ncbi:MAG: TetR/AcrR family transcriptional regulator [Bacteroidetes bacterium]|nr:TetR/AcrR family transcriptional regulator [Bacteroidota bacterium]MBL0139055.1 TetR/AcrR family transcriptional regulator [Bacteroidota bacterium]
MDLSERQLEIIEAAGRILTSSGVSGLTIKNLAAEMKFSEGAIYRHFKSKEDIIIAMLNYLAQTMDSRLTGTLATELSVEEKFIALFRNQFSFFKKNPHFVVAVFSDGLMEASQSINETILKIMDVKLKHLYSVLAEGQKKGVFTKSILTAELVHIAMGAFRLHMYKWRVANFSFDIQQSGDTMIQSVLTLIRTKSK